MIPHVDLVFRILYLRSQGDYEPFNRFYRWIEKAESTEAFEFFVENEKYYWAVISSLEFKDIILEDGGTDWYFIYSKGFEFKAIGKRIIFQTNLLGQVTNSYMTSMWIIKSNIESLKVGEVPINVIPPISIIKSWSSRLNYVFRDLVRSLNDSKVKLFQNVDYKIFKSGQIQIR